MKKYLFLDDDRNPKDVTWVNIPRNFLWEVVRSHNEAVEWVEENGFPDVVSFDHDLADVHYAGDFSKEKTGYDFAKWLVERDLDNHDMPEDFEFYVHSMNPVGAENISNLLQMYKLRRSDK